jgi:hypothetical protein
MRPRNTKTQEMGSRLRGNDEGEEGGAKRVWPPKQKKAREAFATRAPYLFRCWRAYAGSAALAWAITALNTPPSFMARSAMVLRSSSMPASFTPWMNCE